MYREKGLNNVCLDGTERFVSDDNEDLLFFFQVDEVTKPGFFGKSVRIDKNEKQVMNCIMQHPYSTSVHSQTQKALQQHLLFICQLLGNRKVPTEATLQVNCARKKGFLTLYLLNKKNV